jgi:hypothetical protein
MTTQLDFLDHPTRDDMRVFLERLQHSGQPDVRLLTRGDAQIGRASCRERVS